MTDKVNKNNRNNRSNNSDKDGIKFLLSASFALAIAGAGVTAMVGFEDLEGAKDILENELHLEDVKITGKGAFWKCLGSTQFRTAFTAKSNGQDVAGTVCDTWLRPATVNFKTPPPLPQKS